MSWAGLHCVLQTDPAAAVDAGEVGPAGILGRQRGGRRLCDQLVPQAVQDGGQGAVLRQQRRVSILPLLHGRLLPWNLWRRHRQAIPLHRGAEAHVPPEKQGVVH